MAKAACQEADPELFYPEDVATEADKGDNGRRRAGLPTIRQKLVEAAKAVCYSCPVMAECLADADKLEGHSRNDTHGIRAGLTRAERLKMRSEKAA
jgi:ferredoxin